MEKRRRCTKKDVGFILGEVLIGIFFVGSALLMQSVTVRDAIKNAGDQPQNISQKGYVFIAEKTESTLRTLVKLMP